MHSKSMSVAVGPEMVNHLSLPRDTMLAWVIAIATCLSVTSRYCVTTKKASVLISSLPGSTRF